MRTSISCEFGVTSLSVGAAPGGTAYLLPQPEPRLVMPCLLRVDATGVSTVSLSGLPPDGARLVIDDDGGAHLYLLEVLEGNYGERDALYRVRHAQPLDGSWRAEVVAARLSPSYTGGGPGGTTFFSSVSDVPHKMMSEQVWRRDAGGRVTEFRIETDASLGAPYQVRAGPPVLDARGIPRRVVAGRRPDNTWETVLLSALPEDAVVVVAGGDLEAPSDDGGSSFATRVPWSVLPALAFERRVAYPTASGYVKIQVPAPSDHERVVCGELCSGPSPCRAQAQSDGGPVIATTADALWVAWIRTRSDKDVLREDFTKSCRWRTLVDRSSSEVIVARVTEQGLGLQRVFSLSRVQRFGSNLNMHGLGTTLVIGVADSEPTTEMLMIDTTKL